MRAGDEASGGVKVGAGGRFFLRDGIGSVEKKAYDDMLRSAKVFGEMFMYASVRGEGREKNRFFVSKRASGGSRREWRILPSVSSFCIL